MLSFCIVNWNGNKMLEECISSIVDNVIDLDIDYEIIVVDNDSTDNSINSIRQYENVNVYTNKKNYFFAKATNQSIEASKGDVLIIMNNDIVLPKGSLLEYLKVVSINKDIIVSPRLVNFDETTQKSIRNILTPKRFINELLNNKRIDRNCWIPNGFEYEKQQYVEQPLFSFLIMRREIFFRVGKMDTRFPLLFNDVDWFKRAMEKNIKVVYVPGQKIFHYHGYSVNKKKYRKIYISTISLIKYFCKHYKIASILLFPLIIFTYIVRIIREKLR